MAAAPSPRPPFDREADFIAWLNEPVAAGAHPRVSRYLYRIYQDRPDLRARVPRISTGDDCSRYFMWLHGDGVVQEYIPAGPAVLESPRPCDRPRAPTPLHRRCARASTSPATSGLSSASARPPASSGARVEAAGHSVLHVRLRRNREPQAASVRAASAMAGPRTTSTSSASTPTGRPISPGTSARGSSKAATPSATGSGSSNSCRPAMHGGFDVVDEVWAATRFVADAIGRVGRRPVHHVPLALPIPRCRPEITRESLGLPPGFLFLFAFDFFSAIRTEEPARPGRRPSSGPSRPAGPDAPPQDDQRPPALVRRSSDCGPPQQIAPTFSSLTSYYTVEQKNAPCWACATATCRCTAPRDSG